MKKDFIKLLIVAIICAVMTGIFCGSSIKKIEKESSTQQNSMASQAGPIEGYGRIANLAGGIIDDVEDNVENKIINLFVFYFPTVIACSIFILQVIASLLQMKEKNKKRNNTGKVCTYVSISLLALLCITILGNIVITYNSTTLSVNKIMLTLALITNIASLLIFIVEISKIKNNININEVKC